MDTRYGSNIHIRKAVACIHRKISLPCLHVNHRENIYLKRFFLVNWFGLQIRLGLNI